MLVIVVVTVPALAVSRFVLYASSPVGLASSARAPGLAGARAGAPAAGAAAAAGGAAAGTGAETTGTGACSSGRGGGVGPFAGTLEVRTAVERAARNEHPADRHHRPLARLAPWKVGFDGPARARARAPTPRARPPRRKTGLCSSPPRLRAPAAGPGCASGASLADGPRVCCHRGSTDAQRTPEEALEGLPDFPFESRYRVVDGLRLAHLDEGEGAPVDLPARRAHVVVFVAQGDPARARRRLSLPGPGPRRLRALGQAWRHRRLQLRPPRRIDGHAARGSRAARAPPWSCTTGEGRSGCVWPSSTRS